MEDIFSPVFSTLLDSLLLRSQVYSLLFACFQYGHGLIQCYSLFCSYFWACRVGMDSICISSMEFSTLKIIFKLSLFLIRRE